MSVKINVSYTFFQNLKTDFYLAARKPFPNSDSNDSTERKLFHKSLTDKLNEVRYINQSTKATELKKRSRNTDGDFSPSQRLFTDNTPFSRKSPYSGPNIPSNDKSLKSVYSKRQQLEAEYNKKKSQTFDESAGWKQEVHIDSILGSANTSKFQQLVEEYHGIKDSGLKFPPTDSCLSDDSERRRLQFKKLKEKPAARWADNRYIKAISRLQKSYVEND